MKKLLITFAILSISFPAFAQPLAPDTLWTQIIGNQGPSWRPLYSRTVQQCADGGLIITGNVYMNENLDNALLIKTDENGFVLWSQSYGGENYYGASCGRIDFDGGYIITGQYSDTPPFFDDDILLLKTDSLGVQQWMRHFGGDEDEFGSWVEPTADGGYIIFGTTDSLNWGKQFYLLKTNSNGFEQWQKNYGDSLSYEYGSFMQITSDGGYILVGYKLDPDNDWNIYLVRTNNLGDTLWTKIFGDSIDDEFGECVRQTPDGGFIIAGSKCVISGIYGQYDVWLIKTDANGEIEWSQTYGDSTLLEYANSAVQTSDGGYALTGSIHFSTFDDDVLIMKTDAEGNFQWQSNYGEWSSDRGNCIQQLPTGEYIIVGDIIFSGNKIYLIKTEPDPILFPNISIQPAFCNFGQTPIDSTVSLTAQVTNFGLSTLNLIEFIFEPPFYSEIIQGDSSLSNADTTVIRIDFTPIETGIYSDSLGIVSDAVNEDTAWVYLEGEGVNISGIADHIKSNSKFYLSPIYPNPFNSVVKLKYELSVETKVNLKIIDLQGREVVCLVNQLQSPGIKEVEFNAGGISSGIYFAQLKFQDFSLSRKMVLIK